VVRHFERHLRNLMAYNAKPLLGMTFRTVENTRALAAG
jgi:hypothetical protein